VPPEKSFVDRCVEYTICHHRKSTKIADDLVGIGNLSLASVASKFDKGFRMPTDAKIDAYLWTSIYNDFLKWMKTSPTLTISATEFDERKKENPDFEVQKTVTLYNRRSKNASGTGRFDVRDSQTLPVGYEIELADELRSKEKGSRLDAADCLINRGRLELRPRKKKSKRALSYAEEALREVDQEVSDRLRFRRPYAWKESNPKPQRFSVPSPNSVRRHRKSLEGKWLGNLYMLAT
jgi:hypothetical protein